MAWLPTTAEMKHFPTHSLVLFSILNSWQLMKLAQANGHTVYRHLCRQSHNLIPTSRFGLLTFVGQMHLCKHTAITHTHTHTHTNTHTHTRTPICQSRWLYPQNTSGADGRSAAAQPWRLRPAPTTGHTLPAQRPSTSPGTAPRPGWRPALHVRRDGHKGGETTPTVSGQLQVYWQPVLLWTRRLTGGNEDDVDAKDGVSEPSVEAVEASHFQGGVEHSPSKQTHAHRVKNNIPKQCLNVTAHLEWV